MKFLRTFIITIKNQTIEKSTYTNNIIPNDSYYYFKNHKILLHKYCKKKTKKKTEFYIIKQIVTNNGYKPKTIDKIIKKYPKPKMKLIPNTMD